MGRGKAYKNVICLGHILDAEGKKMSKSVGNVVDPWEMMEKYGADALRWWMYTVNQPGESKNFDEKSVDEIVKKVFMILMNVQSFYGLYYSPPPPGGGGDQGQGVHVLDRWILARLDELMVMMTQNLDGYNLIDPVRGLGEFITDLSQWYVRRSRDRFKGDDEHDKRAAMTTLRHVLIELSKLMAPFTPFIAEKIWQEVAGKDSSVHLEIWPQATMTGVADQQIINDMEKLRKTGQLSWNQRMMKYKMRFANLWMTGTAPLFDR